MKMRRRIVKVERTWTLGTLTSKWVTHSLHRFCKMTSYSQNDIAAKMAQNDVSHSYSMFIIGVVPEAMYSNGALLQALTGSYFSEKIPEDEIVAKINEQSQPDVRNSQLEEQISGDMLGKRSNYLKGYGIHKNKYATHSQAMPNPEVDALKQVVADYSTRLETMMLFVATKLGVDPATIPGFIPGSENGEDTLIG